MAIAIGALNTKAAVEGNEKIPVSGSGDPAVTSNLIRASLLIPKSDSHTVELTDAFGTITQDKATATDLTIPPNSSVAFPINTVIFFRRIGVGVMSFVAGLGVTLNTSSGALTDAGLNRLMAATKTDTNTWFIDNGITISITSPDVTGALGFTPVTNARTLAELDLTANRTISEVIDAIGAWHTRVLTTNQTNDNASANTLADCGDLNFPVAANTWYTFRFVVDYTSAAATTGIGLAVNGPTLTSLSYSLRNSSSVTAASDNFRDAYNTHTVATASPSSLRGISVLEGVVRCSASGTLQLRFSSEVSSSAIVVNSLSSFVLYKPIVAK
jgi:hypothetical protein